MFIWFKKKTVSNFPQLPDVCQSTITIRNDPLTHNRINKPSLNGSFLNCFLKTFWIVSILCSHRWRADKGVASEPAGYRTPDDYYFISQILFLILFSADPMTGIKRCWVAVFSSGNDSKCSAQLFIFVLQWHSSFVESDNDMNGLVTRLAE